MSAQVRRKILRSGMALWVGCAIAGSVFLPLKAAPPAAIVIDDVQEKLRNRLESSVMQPALQVAADRIHAPETVVRFYESRGFTPFWTKSDGVRPIARQFEESVLKAADEGLRPDDYHVKAIQRFHRLIDMAPAEALDPTVVSDYEILLTDSFLTYGLHLLNGRVKPEDLEADWIAKPRASNLLAALEAADQSEDLASQLKSFQPRHAHYAMLKQALSRYRKIQEEGGWKPVPEGDKLEKGMTDPRVPVLRDRLRVTGDFTGEIPADPSFFDDDLFGAVVRFQRRHGLDPDGVIGRKSVEALNIPVERRVTQIELNLERWRWLPENLGETHVIVNIAAFHLAVVENDHVALEMPVVVGKPYRRTPVFSDQLTYLVLNPYWQVPPNLAKQDIVPKILADPEYFSKEKMRVFKGWGAEATEIDPATVDWQAVKRGSLNYRFRQDPGPANALGRVKFMFPNQFNVYLHDTPARNLFARPDRAFSSGCIRLGRPIDLALYLLTPAGWTPERIQLELEKNVEETVLLPKRIPIHLLYWTAWAEEDSDTVNFRNDIYERDAFLEAALQKADQ